MVKSKFAIFCALAAAAAAPAFAQDISAASDAARFALNTGLFFAAGLAGLVALLGVGMRDIGFARAQHAPSVCLRMMGGFGACAISFWLIGFNLIYTIESDGLLGAFRIWAPDDQDPMAAGHAAGVFWFFQMTLAAIGAAVISGAVSERVKLWPFLIFAAVYSGLVYPIVASWTWGGGYLNESWRFHDYGGSAVIHVTAGAAALAAALVVGPRPGKYANGETRVAPTTALPLSSIGVGLMLVGWLVVLAGMGKSYASVEAVISVSNLVVNAALASAAGALAALFLTQAVYKRAGLVRTMSGAVAGLVAIAADPLHPALWQAAMIGAVGGVIVTVAPPFLDRYRIDDAAFVIPTHLLCGVWGAVIVPWTNHDVWFAGQLVAVVGVAVFSFFMSLLLWAALKYTIGVRFSAPDE